MQTALLYQRWLEFDLPEGVPDKTLPQWVWPLPLSDGRALITLLYRPLGIGGGVKPQPRTVILELSPDGDTALWKPALGYPAPVLFLATPADDLVGLDLVQRGKVYACRPDGTHLWTLEARPRLANLLTPALFHVEANRILWDEEKTGLHEATLANNEVTNIRPLPRITPLPDSPEVRFPYTHLTHDGSLWVFDFDPMPRVSRYRVNS